MLFVILTLKLFVNYNVNDLKFFSIQGRTPDYDNEAAAEVRSNGRIRMFIPITSRALCPINGTVLDVLKSNV